MQYGIRRVTMEEIAHHLAISKKTIYQFFKDKDEIVQVCTSTILQQEEERIDSINDSASNAVEQFIMTSEYFRKMLRAMNPTLLYDLERYYPEAWKIYQQHQQKCMKVTLKESIERGITEGFFRDDINVEILLRMRMQQVNMGFDPRIYPIHQFNITEVQTEFAEHFMLGIATPKGYEMIHNYIKEKKNQITSQ